MIRRAILNHHRPLLIQRALCSTVAIDVSTAPGRLNKAKVSATESIDYTSGDLQGKLATQVRVRGAMTIKEFMTAALTHPVHGYYMRREEVFGRGGDFVTSPEVSQVFGELVGVWCVACWERLGQPSKLRIIEAGPGRGTLIADILRSTAVFPAFHKALAVDLVEVSEHLKEVQRHTISAAAAQLGGGDGGDDDGGGDASTFEHVELNWHSSLENIQADPSVPELTIAHEFLDALPVHQLVRTPRGWRERMVELKEHTAAVASTTVPAEPPAAAAAAEVAEAAVAAATAAEAAAAGVDEDSLMALRDLESDPRVFDFVLSANPTPASILFGARLGGADGADAAVHETAAEGAGGDGGKGGGNGGSDGGGDGGGEERDQSGGTVRVLGSAEVCPGAISFVQQLCKRMAVTRGAALLIDYGADETPADSLRGILRHAAVHPLHRPGFVDLSVDVDFGTLRQVARQTDAAASDAAGVLRCPPLTTQRDFLAAMGLEMRINALLQKTDDVEARRDLVRSASRLIASPGMGTAYKVFSIAHEDVGADGVAGFAEAPRLTEQGSTDGV